MTCEIGLSYRQTLSARCNSVAILHTDDPDETNEFTGKALQEILDEVSDETSKAPLSKGGKITQALLYQVKDAGTRAATLSNPQNLMCIMDIYEQIDGLINQRSGADLISKLSFAL